MLKCIIKLYQKTYKIIKNGKWNTTSYSSAQENIKCEKKTEINVASAKKNEKYTNVEQLTRIIKLYNLRMGHVGARVQIAHKLD